MQLREVMRSKQRPVKRSAHGVEAVSPHLQQLVSSQSTNCTSDDSSSAAYLSGVYVNERSRNPDISGTHFGQPPSLRSCLSSRSTSRFCSSLIKYNVASSYTRATDLLRQAE